MGERKTNKEVIAKIVINFKKPNKIHIYRHSYTNTRINVYMYKRATGENKRRGGGPARGRGGLRVVLLKSRPSGKSSQLR